MEEVLDIVVLGRAGRNAANIKNRQPIGTMYVKAEETVGEFYKEIIREELNVKEVSFTDDVRDFTFIYFPSGKLILHISDPSEYNPSY